MTSYDIIIAPIVSENSLGLTSEKKYTFRVHPRANKYQIKDIMKTMDARLPFNSETLKKYVTDPHTTSMAKRFFNKHRKN